MGTPDNASILEMADYMSRHGLTDRILAHDEDAIRQIDGMLKEVFKTRNRIKPKIQLSCADKINFMPARYMADNEVLNEMADATPNSNRAYPKALDVFAAFGVKSAESPPRHMLPRERELERLPRHGRQDEKTIPRPFRRHSHHVRPMDGSPHRIATPQQGLSLPDATPALANQKPIYGLGFVDGTET